MTRAHARLPFAGKGQSIGLFGGSFNPPHRGHRHVSAIALKRLGLDFVWWVVTPGNPLKEGQALPSLNARIIRTRRFARHPRVRITAVEADLGTRYTVDLVAALRRMRPSLAFVLLLGADNWADFHRWRGWRRIAALVPIAIVDRPGFTRRALSAPASHAFAKTRLRPEDARFLPFLSPPAWIFLRERLVPISSTLLRQTGNKTNESS